MTLASPDPFSSFSSTNQQVLHPYGNSKNPNNPVDHANEWNKDRININKERVENLEKDRN